MEVSDDVCESCETPLLDITFHKDKTPLENNETTMSACLYCDKILKQTIEKYLEFANKKLNSNFRHGAPSHFKKRSNGGGGVRRKRRGGGSGAKSLNW